MAWETLASQRRAAVIDAIPTEWHLKEAPTNGSLLDVPRSSGILTPAELAITESSAADLVKDLALGNLSSFAVTTAFCKRAAIAQQTVSFIR